MKVDIALVQKNITKSSVGRSTTALYTTDSSRLSVSAIIGKAILVN